MEKFDLLLGVRSKIRVAAFRWSDQIARAVPDKKCLPETGAGRQKRARTSGLRNAGI